MDLGVVEGRTGTNGYRYCCWKGHRLEQLDPSSIGRGLEGLDPEDVVGRDVDWIWSLLTDGLEGTLLMEGTLDPDAVAGKGLEGTSIGRVGRDVDWKGCCCFC